MDALAATCVTAPLQVRSFDKPCHLHAPHVEFVRGTGEMHGMVFAQVSVPVSEWWGGAHALKKARIREQQAENDRLQAREMLAVEIERTWSEVQESYAQILLMRRSVESSAENLRQNRNFYKAGTAPLTDLLDAETLYTQSRNDLTSACASYRTALAKYMRVTVR